MKNPGMPPYEIRAVVTGWNQMRGKRTDAFFKMKEGVRSLARRCASSDDQPSPNTLAANQLPQRLPVLPKLARIDVKLARAGQRRLHHRTMAAGTVDFRRRGKPLSPLLGLLYN